jgi:hypothetical protein
MASYIARRKFLATLLGGAAAAWPLAARAQRSAIPAIGYLNTRAAGEDGYLLAAFHQGLRVCPKTSGGITKFSEHEAD